MIQRVPPWWFFVLFMVSGFSGLVYESIWSHYLRLFLGQAAYAQTLVLAIFMGGMALGSWLCSRYSGRWLNLLIGYAVAEGAIGLRTSRNPLPDPLKGHLFGAHQGEGI
jgi:spermidine synthase